MDNLTARVGWINHADTATLTALHPGPDTLGVERLQIKHVARYHEQAGPELAVRADLHAGKPVDAVVLPLVNAGPAATLRVRAAATAADLAAAPLYTYAGPGHVDDAHNYAIHLLPATVTARVWEVAVTDPDREVSRAGRLVLAPLHRFAFNFKANWGVRWEDLSEERDGAGGQMYSRAGPRRRVLSAEFGEMTRRERDEVALEIERLAGKTGDILMVARPNAPNLAHYTVWGKPVDTGGVNESRLGIFTKTFQIKERRF
ncbi:hypothetical protein [Azospirillum brasilense]|uniref:hypothetical protein n=1 Tax=Azospirillum brasilense TaxID=192 RepID=UPI000E67803F|nr:hypothetical protein [Azospirillum brasilense]NUB28218.1 hypothetical protein [Azospirillum brasilense]NUB33736.1 hypothetical protein [Azospirillum brasilense]RIW04442.1 hypothetical protein D2T81_10810 [Azospirillum brasilense]